jgi:predicted DNA-binding transcriptional regulator AlpA
MLKIIRNLLQSIIDDIDCNNSNIENEEDMFKIIEALKEYTRKDVLLSKYQAYTFLNMSRATFDNKVRAGEIPQGIKIPGFKELMWNKKDLINLINK